MNSKPRGGSTSVAYYHPGLDYIYNARSPRTREPEQGETGQQTADAPRGGDR